MNKKYILTLGMGLLILTIVGLVSSVVMTLLTDNKTIILLIVDIIAILVCVFMLFLLHKNYRKYILDLSSKLILEQKEGLANLPMPCAIIDNDDVVTWINRALVKKYQQNICFGNNFYTTFEISKEKINSETGVVKEINSRIYQVVKQHFYEQDNTQERYLVYFKDITAFKMLEKEHYMSKPCVMIFMIDNYDDLLSNVKESEKANITAKMEKLIEEFVESNKGVVSRVSRERYHVVIEERYVLKLLSEKFNILDKARTIKVNDRLSVTLSIGVGRGGKDMQESELFAKQSLDMSLGRGGDQCAVKTINGFEFFGGVSKGIEKQTKVKTRIVATALRELLETCDNVFVMGHKFGDLDSIGSAIGISAAIRRRGKPAYVVVDKEKNLAKQLIDHITKNDIPDLFIEPYETESKITENSLLIVVDTHNPDFVESKELLSKNIKNSGNRSS